MSLEPNAVLLTLGDLRKWIEERDEVAREIAVLQARLDEFNKRIAVIDALLTPEVREAVRGSPETLAPPKTDFPSWVRAFLSKQDGPVSYRELTAAAEGSTFAERVRRNPNTVYNAITRLAERGEVKRQGKKFIASEVYDRLMAEGIDPFADITEEESGPAIIKKIISGVHPSIAYTSSHMMNLLRSDPVLGAKIKRNSQYGYTLLGRMVKRNQIGRNDIGYFDIDLSDAPTLGGVFR